MISKFFRKTKTSTLSSDAPSVPDGTVVWAIGDIHGRLDLLKPLVDAILQDAAETLAERKVVVFLGDYIDRGPDSRGVLRFLAGLGQAEGIEWRFLKGNHEEAMLRFLTEPKFGPTWCDYGGDAALASYGLKPPTMSHNANAWVQLAADLDHKVETGERQFLDNLELSLAVGDYFFAHAGARPGRSLEAQVPEDLLWIRGSFLDSSHRFSKVVVHGHTPKSTIFADHRRIGIDTKAYESGVLTALRLENASRGVVQSILREPGRVCIDRHDLGIANTGVNKAVSSLSLTSS